MNELQYFFITLFSFIVLLYQVMLATDITTQCFITRLFHNLYILKYCCVTILIIDTCRLAYQFPMTDGYRQMLPEHLSLPSFFNSLQQNSQVQILYFEVIAPLFWQLQHCCPNPPFINPKVISWWNLVQEWRHWDEQVLCESVYLRLESQGLPELCHCPLRRGYIFSFVLYECNQFNLRKTSKGLCCSLCCSDFGPAHCNWQ